MYTIEIIGPPGSGKSTFFMNLQHQLNAMNVPNILMLGTKFYYGNYTTRLNYSCLNIPIYFITALIEIFSNFSFLCAPYKRNTVLKKPKHIRMFKLALKQIYNEKILYQNMPSKSISMLDPGWIMRFLNGYNFSRYAPNDETIITFLNKINLPRILIVLHVSPNTALKRLAKRSRGAPKRMHQLHKEIWPFVINNSNIVSHKIAYFTKTKGIPVYTFNSNLFSTEKMTDILVNSEKQFFNNLSC